jgi:ubiquinone/menaquinone biosynthesis C-methylase UbiE
MVTHTDSVGYVNPEYLRMVGSILNHQKQRTYHRMQIQPGHRVLDVGCGSGMDTIPLASLVGPTGEVYGVDHDAEMIDEAEQRAEQAGVEGWTHHKLLDASSLPFADNYFDSCRSERVFQHLSDPKSVLAEMARVTRQDGWVVVLDTDWATISFDSDDIDMERRFTRFYVGNGQRNGFAGRQLYRLFKEQGLADVTYEAFNVPGTSYALLRQIMSMHRAEKQAIEAKVFTAEELERWRQSLERADAEGTFFCHASLILMAGRKV